MRESIRQLSHMVLAFDSGDLLVQGGLSVGIQSAAPLLWVLVEAL